MRSLVPVIVHGIESSHGIDSHGIDSRGIESRGIVSARFRIPVISTATAKMCIISNKRKFLHFSKTRIIKLSK